MTYDTKEDARNAVYDALKETKAHRFPFLPRRRIPNFADAKAAAERLVNAEPLASAQTVKVNPDSPQRWVRSLLLARGLTVLVPTPRLKGGFKVLDPAEIDEEDYDAAGQLSKMDQWAREVTLEEIPPIDVVVTGCVAVTERGKRCGKGHGYSDLEYAILQELGHGTPPVVTSVHELQVVDDFPTDAHDVLLSVIATSERLIHTGAEPKHTGGINWVLLSEEDLEAMPILRELKGRESRVAGRG